MAEYQKVEIVADISRDVLPSAKGKTTIVRSTTANNTTSTIYTVTNGKIFYLCYAQLGVDSDQNNDVCTLKIGGIILITLVGTSSGIAGARTWTSENCSPTVPLPIPAGTAITITSPTVEDEVKGSIAGWEEDA